MTELDLARAFREAAGLEPQKADTLAQAIFDAIRDNVATKSDIQFLQRDLQATEQTLRNEIRELRQTLGNEIRELRHDLTWRGLVAWASGIGALFAALHYWPPHP